MKKFMLCFGFHFKEAALTKTALIMALLSFVGTIGIFGGIYWWGQRDADTEIVIVQNSEVYTLDSSLLEIEGVTFSFKSYEDLEAAKEELEARDIKNIFIIEGEETPVIRSLYGESSHFESELLISHLIGQQYLARVMVENDISVEVAEQLLAPVEIQGEPLRDEEEVLRGNLVSVVFSIALYILLLGSGSTIATSVVTEKSSRVMEVLTSKINPLTMMFAKILSVLAVMLVNLFSTFVAALVAQLIGWASLDNLAAGILEILDIQTIVLGITFVILGYFLYALLFAAAGAMCSRTEDLQSVITPLTFAIMIPYLATVIIPGHSPLFTIASYIPFFSPFVTVDRLVSGMASTVEVGIVLVIMVISIFILGKLAARIFVNGVMHYNDSVKLKDLKKLLQR